MFVCLLVFFFSSKLVADLHGCISHWSKTSQCAQYHIMDYSNWMRITLFVCNFFFFVFYQFHLFGIDYKMSSLRSALMLIDLRVLCVYCVINIQAKFKMFRWHRWKIWSLPFARIVIPNNKKRFIRYASNGLIFKNSLVWTIFRMAMHAWYLPKLIIIIDNNEHEHLHSSIGLCVDNPHNCYPNTIQPYKNISVNEIKWQQWWKYKRPSLVSSTSNGIIFIYIHILFFFFSIMCEKNSLKFWKCSALLHCS